MIKLWKACMWAALCGLLLTNAVAGLFLLGCVLWFGEKRKQVYTRWNAMSLEQQQHFIRTGRLA